MKPTVRDIAKEAGVSIASVSLILNNKPCRITDATRQKILDTAKALGYNFEEKKKKEQESLPSIQPFIGFLCPGYNHEFYNTCLKGIHHYAKIHGYEVITCHGSNSTDFVLDQLKILTQAGVSGVILIPPADMNEQNHNEILEHALTAMGLPFLLLSEAIDRVFCDFITADNKGGAYLAVEHLIHQGHLQIGMIAGKKEVYTTRKRVEGYKEALAFYNLSIKEEQIFFGEDQRKTGYMGMKHFHDLGIQTVFASNDEIAAGVYDYGKEHHLKIGEDVSVVGFGDSMVASMLIPPLTTVNQLPEQMGKKACEEIIKRITGENKDPIRTTYFTPSLVERNSVKNKKIF